MARPRNPDIEEVMRECPVHGMTDHRRHAKGFRGGVQKHRYRCLKCHAAKNLEAWREARDNSTHDPT